MKPKTNQRATVPLQIRWMIRRDIPRVLDVAFASCESPWVLDDFLFHLRQPKCIGMVAEITRWRKELVVGFMVYRLHKNRLELLNFAVDPDFWRTGIGTQMVDKLINKLSQQRRTQICTVVPEANLRAQLFFRGRRFLATEVVQDDSGESAGYAMEYTISYEENPR